MTLAQPCAAVCVPTRRRQPVDLMSTRARVKLIVILGALTALGPLTIDTYLPALPSITRDLQTTSAAVGLTLTGTLIGFALGQVLLGPLSDRSAAGDRCWSARACTSSPPCCARWRRMSLS